MLECVVNVSEGRDAGLVRFIAGGEPGTIDAAVLDIHSDADHNRSVYTTVGTSCVRDIARRAVEVLDVSQHAGVHPRLGVVDVVPFVALDGSGTDDALRARDDFAHWASTALHVPVFLYGPERTLPDVRRTAWTSLSPDHGPDAPHPTAGAMCVGVRPVLIAYNVFLATSDMNVARIVAARVRRPGLRTLAFLVAGSAQVSMNIIDTETISVADAYDLVASETRLAGSTVQRAELVGLLPQRQLAMVDETRWEQLDIGPSQTIEARLNALS